MRFRSLSAVLAAVLVSALAASQSAEAGWWRERAPDGWGTTRDITHHVYYPRYRHIYRVHPHTDPYAYYYEPRGYYTNSSSRYWRPAYKVHRPGHRNIAGHKYRYHAAWGHRKSRRRYHHWR